MQNIELTSRLADFRLVLENLAAPPSAQLEYVKEGLGYAEPLEHIGELLWDFTAHELLPSDLSESGLIDPAELQVLAGLQEAFFRLDMNKQNYLPVEFESGQAWRAVREAASRSIEVVERIVSSG